MTLSNRNTKKTDTQKQKRQSLQLFPELHNICNFSAKLEAYDVKLITLSNNWESEINQSSCCNASSPSKLLNKILQVQWYTPKFITKSFEVQSCNTSKFTTNPSKIKAIILQSSKQYTSKLTTKSFKVQCNTSKFTTKSFKAQSYNTSKFTTNPSKLKAIILQSSQQNPSKLKAIILQSSQQNPSKLKAIILQSSQQNPSKFKAIILQSSQ